MIRRRGIQGPPRSYLVEGQWPVGRVQGPAPAEVARKVAESLQGALAGRSLRDIARAAQLEHTTLRDLLAGETWPDLITIARLEDALGVALWPTDRP